MKLRITCKTAVTPSSGESWGGIIDTDIVYDDLGIPFITAKRIKGILRESALDVVYALQQAGIYIDNCSADSVTDLFGKRGSIASSSLQIENAYPEQINKIRESLLWMKQHAPELCTKEQVLDLFTDTRSQTAVADKVFNTENLVGVALDHSLRVQRVLNRGMIFICSISFDVKYTKLLAMAAQVSRNMGLGRNRGIGQVKIELLGESAGQNQFDNCIVKADFAKKVGSNGK